MFKAEKFDPEVWAKLFKDSGAKYVVPAFEHHDGFAMYDSNLSDWTPKKMAHNATWMASWPTLYSPLASHAISMAYSAPSIGVEAEVLCRVLDGTLADLHPQGRRTSHPSPH